MKRSLNDYRFVIIFLCVVAECICFCEYGYSKVVVDIDLNHYESRINGDKNGISLDKSNESIYENSDTTENGVCFLGTVTLPEVDIRNLPAIDRIIDTVIRENDSIYSNKNLYYSLYFNPSEKIENILKSSGKLNDNPIWFYEITPIIGDYIEESYKNKYPGYFYYMDRLFLIQNMPDNGIELNHTGRDREFTLYRTTIPRFKDCLESFFIVNGNTVWRLQPHLDDEGVLTWNLFRVCWKQRTPTTNF